MVQPHSLGLSEQGLERVKNNILRIKKNHRTWGWNDSIWLQKADEIDSEAQVGSESTLKRFKKQILFEFYSKHYSLQSLFF